jgi:hypothetical protein
VPVVTLHRESVPSTALFMKRLLDVVCSLGHSSWPHQSWQSWDC